MKTTLHSRETPPTAETIACQLFNETSPRFADINANLAAVHLVETVERSATYYSDGVSEVNYWFDFSAARRTMSPQLKSLTTAPGNGAPIGGLKIVAASGWFAARPSGTEDVYKLYAESFRGPEHLAAIQDQAREIVAAAIAGA